MKALLYFFLKIIILLLLPFVVLIRGAVFMHENYTSNPQIAILSGALATVILLMVYFIYVFFRATGKLGNGTSFKLKMVLAGVLVLAYCFNGLFFLNGGACENGSGKRGIYKPAPDSEAEHQHDTFH